MMALEGTRSRGATVATNSLWSAADQLVSYVGGFVAVVAVARVLGPEKLGHYTYILFLCSTASVLGSFGIPTATRKYLAEFLGRRERQYFRAIIRISYRFQLAVAIVIVLLGLTLVVTSASSENRIFAAVAVLSILPQMLMAIPTSVNIALEDFSANVFPSLVSQLVHLAVIASTLILGWGLVGLAAALLASRVVDLAIRYELNQRRVVQLLRHTSGHSPLPADVRERIRRFCLQSTVLQVLSIVVWNRSELLFLKHFCDIEQIAFYSAGFGFTRQLLLAPQVFTAAAGASLMVRVGHDPQGARRMAAVTLRYVALLILPLTIGLAALSGPAIRLTYGSQYLPAVPVLTILALFGSAKALLLPVEQLLIALDRQQILVSWMLIMALLNVALDFLLIPSGGALGAAIANGTVQTATMVGLWVFAVRRLQTPFPGLQMLRLLVSTASLAVAAGTVGLLLPPLPAALIGVPFGAVVYLTLVRTTGCLDATDRDRLRAVEKQLPSRLRCVYRWILRQVTTC